MAWFDTAVSVFFRTEVSVFCNQSTSPHNYLFPIIAVALSLFSPGYVDFCAVCAFPVPFTFIASVSAILLFSSFAKRKVYGHA